MGTFHSWPVALGMVLAGVAGAAPNAAARRAVVQSGLTIHVSNYAHVGAKELANAERVAAAVFAKAGVASTWVDISDLSGAPHTRSGDPNPARLSLVSVHIQSSSLAGTLGLRDSAMGLAPGAGPERKLVYVFYDRVKQLAQRQVAGQVKGEIVARASECEILGEMIAHEIGHILLDMPGHSETGIMRGGWDLKDLQDVAYGSLFFTAEQERVIRAEVVRRAGAGLNSNLAVSSNLAAN
jgi:hypothetical protein